MLTILKKVCSSLLITAIFVLGMHIPEAHAAMVSTNELSHFTAAQQDRARISAFLDRTDVQKQLEALGVNPIQAKARVASLTDSEAHMLNNKLNKLPAGGDGFVGAIIGAAVLIFIILLITDILGLTDVFGFVNHHAFHDHEYHHAHEN